MEVEAGKERKGKRGMRQQERGTDERMGKKK